MTACLNMSMQIDLSFGLKSTKGISHNSLISGYSETAGKLYGYTQTNCWIYIR